MIMEDGEKTNSAIPITTVQEINTLCKNTLITHLGIKITEYTKDHVTGTMPVDDTTRQPMGFLHGGATLSLAETMASIGSAMQTDLTKYHIFGVQVTGNHLKTVRSGLVTATAKLLHKGKTSHIWDCDIRDQNHKLISVVRVSIAVVEKK